MLPWVPYVHAPLGGRTGQVLSVQIYSVFGSHWQREAGIVSVSSTIDSDVRSIPQACTPLKVCGVECICMLCDVLDKAEQVILLVYNA